jgi:hypothetical protein
MTNSDLIDIFNRLSYSIQKNGECENRRIKGSLFKLYTTSEISLITESVAGEWMAEGLFFEIFGTEVLLNKDGTLSVSDTENNALEVYSMNDKQMLQAVHVFLKWRLAALNLLRV